MMRLWTLISFACVISAATCARAQTVAESRAGVGEPNQVLANGGLVHTLTAEPVVGAPFSAMQQHQTVQILADGSKVNKGSGHHAVLRDSQGRVRVEDVEVCSCQVATVTVYVMDPVAHTLSIWSTDSTRVATVYDLPADTAAQREVPVALTDAAGARSRRAQPTVTTENLGVETLLGLPVQAVKTTTIVPAGRSGNDSPITKTDETWTSAEMKLVLKEEFNDPRTGVRTVELANFSRAEPAAALFRAPSDFRVNESRMSSAQLQRFFAGLEGKN